MPAEHPALPSNEAQTEPRENKNPRGLFLGPQPDEWAAIGTMVNAVVILFLARFNFRYMQSASQQAAAADKQAKASEAQAAAALEQARTASETLTILKVQIEEQTGQARSKYTAALQQMKGELIRQSQRLESDTIHAPQNADCLA